MQVRIPFLRRMRLILSFSLPALSRSVDVKYDSATARPAFSCERAHASFVDGAHLLLALGRGHRGVEIVAGGDETVHEAGDDQQVGEKPQAKS